MSAPASSSRQDLSRAAARREQILCAAAQCFREFGFHAASITKISRAAGMSPGHIYHYFANKEAIIAAIIAQDLEVLLALSSELRAAPDVRANLLQRAGERVGNHLDPEMAGLKLEIAAEAARNPAVAKVVREADEASRQELAATIHAIRQASGYTDSDRTIDGIVEVIICLFEGMLLRAIRNPDLAQDELALRIRDVIAGLLEVPTATD